ncbi:MaoC family dehydratase N-terminal domain-containing protein [Pseudonocardia sp. RS11V-5]|uniref:FAS1-like dehydratase domain-containing protein n=1 Tax=Pseudonocardia terrae TaxID=2905831 RepID=UPI001E2D2C20|nr:MaoC family dehydratase N-terminal domain-containing protein [Pseudonocardia terrae]MCE3551164.1 MaoC family dehydratase N-terminal domain-containing protein [Pseudonocardia terrae]
MSAERTRTVGDVLDEVAFTVEAGKVGEFARATHATDPVHSDPVAAAAAGFGALAATPTHVVVSGHHRDQRAMVERLGLALERVIVGSVRWRYRRPLVVGDELRGVRRLVGDERVGGGSGRPPMRRITLETTFVDAAGEAAVEWREVVLERGVPS